MKLINKDLTRESIHISITNTQIYAEILHKEHGKWLKDTYFQSYGWEPDEESIQVAIRYIKRVFGLRNPKVVVVEI